MSNYPNTTLTHAGQDLIAESITEGEALIFTKVVLGDGELQEGQSIAALTALISPKLNVSMTSGSSSGGQVKLRFAVGNSGLDEGFFAREVGIFAKVGENGTETLYAYTNGGNYVDFIPDKTRPIDNQIMDVYIVTGNAPNVTVHISDEAFALAKDLIDHNSNAKGNSHPHQLRPPLKRSTAYAKGDICFHDSLPSYAYLECITAGTTAETEPSFGGGRASDHLTDGTAVFIVRDMRCKYRTGQIVTIWGTPAEYDYLLLCDGSQISTELYPELVKVLGGNTLPDLAGRFLEGAGSAGEYKEAGLPNIMGTYTNDSTYCSYMSDKGINGSNGAISWTTKLYTSMTANSNANYSLEKLTFDASKSNPIYGSSTTVQPKSMTVKYYICYAG